MTIVATQSRATTDRAVRGRMIPRSPPRRPRDARAATVPAWGAWCWWWRMRMVPRSAHGDHRPRAGGDVEGPLAQAGGLPQVRPLGDRAGEGDGVGGGQGEHETGLDGQR